MESLATDAAGEALYPLLPFFPIQVRGSALTDVNGGVKYVRSCGACCTS